MKRLIKILVFIFTVVSISLVSGQSAKESIFGDVEKLINDARNQNAELLSPGFFSKAVKSFQTANEYYINNESSRDIREKLTEARELCNRAMEVVNLATITLKDPIKAREDAVRADASTFSKNIFTEAEEKFEDAAREIEDGDIEDARDKGSEAEVLYRNAELKSIKDKILNGAREQIVKAREVDADEYTPQTFFYASNLLNEVEELLKNNRYAFEEATAKANECEYQALHAIYLTQEIKTLKEDEKNWEKLILQFEDVLTSFASRFDEKPHYDTGIKDAVNQILARIEQLQNERQNLFAENAKLAEEFSEVKEKATSTLTELAKKQLREAKIEKIKSMFKPNEAKVIFDGENLVIRLYGINFQSGQSVIQPEYFSLITKIQSAIKEFPENHIILEGHTDSQGIPQTNKRLSEDRAMAVREYIIANMAIDRDQITAIGYGDAVPVASNKTAEGRSLNRRIDVVINISE